MTNSREEKLHSAWKRLLEPFSPDAAASDRAFRDLVAAYSMPERHYHNLEHLGDILAAVDRLADHANDLTAVKLAAWYHDAVYDSRAKDNEERSADSAVAVLPTLGVPAALCERVRDLILVTKSHVGAPDNADAAVLCDADLAILATPTDCYTRYADAIRREYSWVPEGQYRIARSQVLRRFLSYERIFRTDAMASSESQARTNLAAEIAALTGADY
jgi:predicted metal-dependent HD superfamily phosphohydrolase